jgi:glutathione synthase/RimK-type ligase-like ATP-grasp enzyme
MKKLKIYPYKMASESAKALKDAIPNALRVAENGNYRQRNSHLVLNWGNSNVPVWSNGTILNDPERVAIATDKLKTFMALDGVVNLPEWTTVPSFAKLLLDEGKVLFARTKLNGHSGDGIVIIDSLDKFVDAPLYTVYKKKRSEYRVHVFNGEVIDVVEKRRSHQHDHDGEESMIRSHHNGWVFCRDNIQITDALKGIALNAITSLDLDFGAVDVIYNQRENTYYVLEVNTAPALTGTTLENYKNAITKLLG